MPRGTQIPVQAKRVGLVSPPRESAVLQKAKVKDLPGFNDHYKGGYLKQGYFANIHKEHGHSRYVLFFIEDSWHITFTPKNPKTDPYQQAAYWAFQNEEYDGTDWQYDKEMIGELEYGEFHITTGKLHKGTAKHFFYSENGNFLHEEGKGIKDLDRRTADMLRWRIKPHALSSAYSSLLDPSTMGWPPSEEELKRIMIGQVDFSRVINK